MASSWSTYFNEITDNAPGSSVAARLQISGSKVSYWRRGVRPPSPREAVHIARAYGRNPLEGLVAAGYLEAADVADQVSVIAHTLADYTDVELAQEVLRRTQS